jgi:hypothetical protein
MPGLSSLNKFHRWLSKRKSLPSPSFWNILGPFLGINAPHWQAVSFTNPVHSISQEVVCKDLKAYLLYGNYFLIQQKNKNIDKLSI